MKALNYTGTNITLILSEGSASMCTRLFLRYIDSVNDGHRILNRLDHLADMERLTQKTIET